MFLRYNKKSLRVMLKLFPKYSFQVCRANANVTPSIKPLWIPVLKIACSNSHWLNVSTILGPLVVEESFSTNCLSGDFQLSITWHSWWSWSASRVSRKLTFSWKRNSKMVKLFVKLSIYSFFRYKGKAHPQLWVMKPGKIDTYVFHRFLS